jgi:hypothetical protein
MPIPELTKSGSWEAKVSDNLIVGGYDTPKAALGGLLCFLHDGTYLVKVSELVTKEEFYISLDLTDEDNIRLTKVPKEAVGKFAF